MARDSAGNDRSAWLTVRVRDLDAPHLNLPPSRPEGAAVTWQAAAPDNVDGNVAISCDRTPGGVFPLGNRRVTCRAVDRAGNAGHGAFVVGVRDREAPVLTLPKGPVPADAVDARGATVTFAATAADAVEGAVPVKCDHSSGSLFPLGDTTVSCSASDSSGNASNRGRSSSRSATACRRC